MATKEQLEDHKWCIKRLEESQEADHDSREHARESHYFVDKRDGQWEPEIFNQFDGKPRYTFDMVNPIIDQVSGEMEERDFDIRVSPAGGNATKDTAQTFDGLVRNIENVSRATQVYNLAGKNMVTSGIDGWRVNHKYLDEMSFDQDLVIEPIGDYVNRVWFGPHEKPDASDARFCWVLTGMDPDEYKRQYPNRTPQDVGSDKSFTAYFHRNDLVVVGEFFYILPESAEIALLSDGQVVEVNEEFNSVRDELELAGIVVEKTRKTKKHSVYTRLFDASGWISEPRPSVFRNWLPIVPCYGNFKYYEDKVLYWGVVDKLMDSQRVYNYAQSRQIEEGALAPRRKVIVTQKQIEGYEEDWAELNTSIDPYIPYNHDEDGAPPPGEIGGAQVNPGLKDISESMRQLIGMNAGMFAANMGDNPGLQSGKAIEALQDRGDRGNNKYTTAREVAQSQTARILVDAIPRVYTPQRQVRLLREDGSEEMAVIGQIIQDQQSGEFVTIHDLQTGKYDVECHSGPSFANRQSETVNAITQVAQHDPTILQESGDILLNNVSAPGMDQAAARRRRALFLAGVIPPEQMTPEEQAEAQAMADQPPQESPEMVLARAEESKAMADHQDAQNKATQIQADHQVKTADIEVRRIEAETKRIEALTKAELAGVETEKIAAEALKAIKEAEAQEIENDAVQSNLIELVESSAVS